ncbi:MAG: hypothetical protein H0V31_03135 [Acidobacteria bacterium]|jgi:predicted nucleotidyltransferase|nr:hypothetical protein [Acidobacteriota bacterium]
MVELEPAIKSLIAKGTEFVIIGGVAISIHSTGYVTRDLDFCYLRTTQNLKKIVSAFAPFNPHLRGFPEELPFVWDERTLQNGTNFTLKTTIGDIDLLGEVAGVGSFEAVKKESILTRLYGCDVRVLTLEGLIKAKRAAGRTKDLLVLPELEALQEALKESE